MHAHKHTHTHIHTHTNTHKHTHAHTHTHTHTPCVRRCEGEFWPSSQRGHWHVSGSCHDEAAACIDECISLYHDSSTSISCIHTCIITHSHLLPAFTRTHMHTHTNTKTHTHTHTHRRRCPYLRCTPSIWQRVSPVRGAASLQPICVR
jgi:hypothetical protein